ncbi:hypothetical protein Bca4012_089566 [Brassica carinata]|uniref:Uncharacterized protein n=1 Tax=Brassica carinata TaxID=52824 RepID=A0A8X7PAT3_BRACI|nr:hypothetical protein Bca52824_086931 [Brassica carinata]
MAPSRNLSISLFAIVSVSFSSFMFGSLNPSLIRARTLIRDLIYDSYRDGPSLSNGEEQSQERFEVFSFRVQLVRTRRASKEKHANSIPTLLLTHRSLEREWLHKILCLLYYSSLINKDSSQMLERACNVSVSLCLCCFEFEVWCLS